MTPARPKLLVVDDEPLNIQAIYQAFAQDHQVFMATTGEQALTISRENPPDLILLDLSMPGMSGIEVCARLKADHATSYIPVVFVSAQTGVQQITQALEPGAVDFITKPLNVSVLRARVKTHLNAKFQTDYFRLRSSMDPVTGVFNFRDLEQRLESEWARAHRADSSLTLAIVSADGFDDFSETHGKSAADERLKQIAAILKHRMRRPADMIARYGPSVFACLLPETALSAALTVAHATFAEFEQKNLIQENASGTVKLTVSAGLVTRASKCTGDVAGFFSLAEQQLLLAQQSGGNQVCSDTFSP